MSKRNRIPHILRSPFQTRFADEHGATMVLFTIVLVVLLGFAAIVVDLANGRQQKRLAQNSVDAVVFAAAQDLATYYTSPVATRQAQVTATVKDYALRNFSTATAAWSGCTDPAPLDLWADTADATNHCISLDSATMTKVRVQLPTRNVPTSFGKVLGKTSLPVKAAATAQISSPAGDRVLPLGLSVGAGTGNLCVENSGNDTECSSRSSGNFGDLNSPRLVSYRGLSDSDTLRINFALGTDHVITKWTSDPKVCDGDLTNPCTLTNDGTTSIANYMNTATGNNTNEPTDGLFSGFTAASTFFCGRLQRPDTTDANVQNPMPGGSCVPGMPTRPELAGNNTVTINGRHVAYYMFPGVKSAFYGGGVVPTTQAVVDYGETPDPYAVGDGNDSAGLQCFVKNYRFGGATPSCAGVPGGMTAPLFKKEIVTDPRFGWIPILDWPNGGSAAVKITGYWAVFMYRSYTTNTKLKAIDAWVFDPTLIEAGTNTSGPGLGSYSGGAAVVQLVG
jgi:Flp pilus assembly protein TadG